MTAESKSKLLSIISYITWVGWIVALVIRDKGDELVRHNLNQALLLNIAMTVIRVIHRVPILGHLVGNILDIAAFVMVIVALYRAYKGEWKPLPYVGEIDIL